MDPDHSKQKWHVHLSESWIIIAIVALILLLLVWRPFNNEEPEWTAPELEGPSNNLSIREILERRLSEGAGRLFPSRGFGGLSPHQEPADPTAPTDDAAPADAGDAATDGAAPAPGN